MCAGTVLALIKTQEYESLLRSRGLFIHNHTTTLPMKKGLSSSAAVCVLIAQCFDVVYDLSMSTSEVMEVAYVGEMCTPSRYPTNPFLVMYMIRIPRQVWSDGSVRFYGS